jgi:hypothetical protein
MAALLVALFVLTGGTVYLLKIWWMPPLISTSCAAVYEFNLPGAKVEFLMQGEKEEHRN